MTRIKKMIIILILCPIIGILTFLLYYNRAFPETLEIASEMKEDKEGYYFDGVSDTGFIIFPGVKADERSYAYIARLLYNEGHTVAIPKIRFHLISSPERGIKIMKDYTEISKWYLIGHSAGGMSVTRIALSTPEDLSGIIYLASYIMEDMSECDIRTLRISASDDGIMDEERMQASVDFLPKGAIDIVMDGTNHQGFGAYDSVSEDGQAKMTWKEQQEKTVKHILDFLEN